MPFALMAQYYGGIITLNNGKNIKAFIKEPVGNDSKLKYRYTKDGSNEKLEIDEVKSIEYYDNDNKQIVFHTMLLSSPKMLKPGNFNISDKKHWAKLLKEGQINLYEVYTEEHSPSGSSYIYRYYITDENDTYGRYLFMPMPDVLNRIKYRYAKLDYYLKLYYGNKCPAFVKSVKYEDLDKYGLGKIVDLYEEFCGN